jgi:hypothetical protein
VIEHALRAYYADSSDPNELVGELLAKYDADGRAAALEDAAGIAVRAARGCGDSEAGQYAASVAASIGKQLRGMAAEMTQRGSEKDTRGESSPLQGESTHRHPRPCEFPTVLPCTCPRPSALPEASFIRARHRRLIAAFFRGAADAQPRAAA